MSEQVAAAAVGSMPTGIRASGGGGRGFDPHWRTEVRPRLLAAERAEHAVDESALDPFGVAVAAIARA